MFRRIVVDGSFLVLVLPISSFPRLRMYSTGLLSCSLVLQPIRPFLLRCPTLARPRLPVCSAEPERPRKSSGSGSGRGRASPPMESGAEAPGRRGARRRSFGTSRRSSIKKSFAQEQVVFTKPVAEDPVVAIIGGGVAGLVCALTLEERGIKSTVFDTVCYYPLLMLLVLLSSLWDWEENDLHG